jgi:hypothetical protein
MISPSPPDSHHPMLGPFPSAAWRCIAVWAHGQYHAPAQTHDLPRFGISRIIALSSASNANNAAPANIDRTVFIVAIPH